MVTSESERRLLAVAATQLGLFTFRQAAAAGVSSAVIRHRVRHGSWERLYPEVYAVTGVGWWPTRRLLAAVLAGHGLALASHRCGAWLWSLTPHPQVPEISLPRSRRITAEGVRIHRMSDLPSAPTLRLGIPTTDVERTLIDVGAVLRPARVATALDRAIALKHTTPARVAAELNQLAANGRKGVGVMRAILDEAGVTGSYKPSALEAKTRRLIRAAGLPDPECELVAGQNGEYRLDFPWPDAMLDLEVDGWMYHSSFDAFYRDRTRQNALTLQGFAFLRYTWKHVVQTPHVVVRELRAAYRARVGLFV